jgi:trehalose 6-phosphate synthase complex regulatory subunit
MLGTYGSFGAAIRINPWNYREVADAIHEALEMPAEDKLKYHKELFKHVVSNTAAYWAESFMLESLRVSSDMQRKFSVTIPHLPTGNLLEYYKQAEKVVFLLNYDGTLVPFEKTPDIDVSSTRLHEILGKLTSKPKNLVYVISGRTKTALDRRLGNVPNLGLRFYAVR